MLALHTDLCNQAFIRDGGQCTICLHSARPVCDLEVRNLDMTHLQGGETLGDVTIICLACALVVERYLALTKSRTEPLVAIALRFIEASE